jgi:hypothetical protein
MTKVIPNGFELVKMKLLGNGGIEIQYTEAKTDGDITNIEEITVKSPKDPHPDLTTRVDLLKNFVLRTHNFLMFQSLEKVVTTAKTKEAIKTLESTFNALQEELENHVKVKGFSLSGSGDNLTIKINAENTHMSEKLTLDSPSIKIHGEKWKFEHDLKEIVEELIEEAKAFLFQGKAKQLEMQFGEAAIAE